ncbi:MAG: PilZ domain-containing protein [Chloroflexi bacterium]|nr:MAG: PilZ domain-containing protein [Chloroflexota bacterium]MBL1195385.1 PilZ domain-containing protein [Chloroflexota bacterium]NOH12668.1 PilZ domain-containing protein [Chloroflexota bacterium]
MQFSSHEKHSPVYMQDNRRKEPRFVVTGIALYTPDGRKLLGEVLNLSSGGMLLLSKEYIPPGQQLKLQMRFPPLLIDQEDIEIDVYVVWSDEDEDGHFKTGMLIEPRPGQVSLFERAINILGE